MGLAGYIQMLLLAALGIHSFLIDHDNSPQDKRSEVLFWRLCGIEAPTDLECKNNGLWLCCVYCCAGLVRVSPVEAHDK